MTGIIFCLLLFSLGVTISRGDTTQLRQPAGAGNRRGQLLAIIRQTRFSAAGANPH